MTAARSGHMATLLTNGRVLVAAGQSVTGTVDSAELYDPASGHWSTTGSMMEPRAYHAAARLATGQILVAGGGTSPYEGELYNPR